MLKFILAGSAFLALSSFAQAQDSQQGQSGLSEAPVSSTDALKEAGVDLSARITQFGQGLVRGSSSNDWESGGKADVFATFDGEKLGLWPGLIVSIHGELAYGNDVNSQGDGSVLPLNTALAFPALGGHDTDLSVVVTQVFSPSLSFSMGKFNMLDAAAKAPLVGGGGIDSFQNLALAAPPSGITPPYLLGGILSYKTEPATFTFMVYDPRNAQDSDVISHPFKDGVTTSVSATIPVSIGGRTGYQGLRAAYSTQDGLDLASIPQFSLPPESQNILTKDGYWYFSYSFQQYLFQNPTNPNEGWGVFGQIGVSDGNPNPVKWSGYLGLGGSGLFRDRPDDKFGIAYFRTGFSSDLKNGLEPLGIDIDDEQGLEVFYNYAVTPRFNLTMDAQMIDPGVSEENNVILGLRAEFDLF